MTLKGQALLWLAFSCLGVHAPNILGQHCVADDEKLWSKLLQASLEKTPKALELVEKAAEGPPNDPAKSLALALLEEWELPTTADELRQPRIVHAPKPDYSDLLGSPIPPVQSSVVVVTGVVTPHGMVENIQLEIGTEVKAIDERCLKAFQQWRYRPARGKNGYVSSKVAATCYLHLK